MSHEQIEGFNFVCNESPYFCKFVDSETSSRENDPVKRIAQEYALHYNVSLQDVKVVPAEDQEIMRVYIRNSK